jgi:hypothetical protein
MKLTPLSGNFRVAITLLLFPLLMISLTQCGKGTDTSGAGDSTVFLPDERAVSESENGEMSTAVGGVYEEPILPDLNNLVAYDGPPQDSVWSALTVYPPFEEIQRLAWPAIQMKDSLAENGFSPADSAVFRPAEIKAHRAILDYQRIMSSPGRLVMFPGLFALPRTAEVTDSGATFLPRPGPSVFFDKNKSFFIGGAPFIDKLSPEDDATFTGPDGTPELRFESTLTENGNIIFNFLAHNLNPPANVNLGPPLDSYYFSPREVNGIGSLIHSFKTPIAVLFITENGLVPAKMISITFKIIGQYQGCLSDQPKIIFSCSQMVDQNDILGVYLSATQMPVNSGVIHRQSRSWTADLDNDGIVDLVGLRGASLGEASGSTLSEAIWYVNMNGEWLIVDWATDLDCT